MASDATPIVEYTKNVTYLNDNEIASVIDGKLTVKTIDNVEQTPYIQTLEMNLEAIEKGGYEHFMLKEIHEQPVAVVDTLRDLRAESQRLNDNAETREILLKILQLATDHFAKG